jgi:hypothetical protein
MAAADSAMCPASLRLMVKSPCIANREKRKVSIHLSHGVIGYGARSMVVITERARRALVRKATHYLCA